MNIHKLNYEQYVLDYLEGNLSGEMHLEMLAFLQKNPDIKNEIEGLEQVLLIPGEDIIYEHKADLLKEEKVPFRLPYGMIAAVLLLLVVSVFYYKNYNSIKTENLSPIVNTDADKPELNTITTRQNGEIMQQGATQKSIEDKQDQKGVQYTRSDKYDNHDMKSMKSTGGQLVINNSNNQAQKSLNTPIVNDDKVRPESALDKKVEEKPYDDENHRNQEFQVVALLEMNDISTLPADQGAMNLSLMAPRPKNKLTQKVEIAGREYNLDEIRAKIDSVIEVGKEKGLISEMVTLKEISLTNITDALIPESF